MHDYLSIDAEKAFEKKKTQHTFLENAELEGTHLNIIKVICEKPTANTTLYGEKLEAIPLQSGTRQGCPSLLCFNTVLKAPAEAIRQEWEIKGKKIKINK